MKKNDWIDFFVLVFVVAFIIGLVLFIENFGFGTLFFIFVAIGLISYPFTKKKSDEEERVRKEVEMWTRERDKKLIEEKDEKSRRIAQKHKEMREAASKKNSKTKK